MKNLQYSVLLSCKCDMNNQGAGLNHFIVYCFLNKTLAHSFFLMFFFFLSALSNTLT